MPNDLYPVMPGQPLPQQSASRTNAILATAREASGPPLRPDVTGQRHDSSTVLIRNSSGGPLKRFAIVGITDPVFDPIDNGAKEQTLLNHTCFDCRWPAEDNDSDYDGYPDVRNAFRGRFAILLQPIRNGVVGTGRISGTQICFIESYASVGDTVDIDEAAQPDPNTLCRVDGGCAVVLWCGPARDGAFRFVAVVDGDSPTGFSWSLAESECYITPTAAEVTTDIGEPTTIDDVHSGTGPVVPPGSQWGLIRFGGSGGGGLGNEWIDFRVVAWCPAVPGGTTQAVDVEVIGRSCHSSVSIGDIIRVFDPNNCWLNLPIELLSGLVGRADLAAVDGASFIFCAEFQDLGECYWKITSLCCREESVYYT